MDREEYLSYLKSDDWKDKRKEFLEEENFICEECGGKATQVHHVSYANVGDEDREDIMVLCKNCHLDKHSEDGKDGDEEYGEW